MKTARARHWSGNLLLRWFSCWGAVLLCIPGAADAQLHHQLEVLIKPEQHSLEVQDTITLQQGSGGSLIFALHPQMQPELVGKGARLSALPDDETPHMPALNLSGDAATVKPRRFRVELSAGVERFTLRYRGSILHALQTQGEEYARSFRETQGMISPQGVFLAGPSFWYPHIEGQLLKYELSLRLPEGWRGMTQGERLTHEAINDSTQERWHCDTPQEEVYLIAGRFTEYEAQSDGVKAMVLLRQADPGLAQKYLDATQQYTELYSDLIGPYPFRKFALVENFWETGYGMPSFTLLGPKVIRFPFILHSSYPHEILHNWWGNSVYVDYQSGNWAEGLTSYLADHLIKEQRGLGVEYRRTALQKYTDYVSQQQDFPLSEFRSRHSARTEALGYGKTLMLFHMLRRKLGDDVFIEGLRTLYAQQQFRVTDFEDVQQRFSDAAQQPLQTFFSQWVERRGAPQLRVKQARTEPRGDGYLLSADIEQIQPGAAYTLELPVAVHLEGTQQAYQTDVTVEQKRKTLELQLPARPLRLDVDPEFDVFRRLHRDEIPPAISQVMGAGHVLIVLAAQSPPELKSAYRALASSWQSGTPDKVEIAFDEELARLPRDRSVWLFGWRNRFRPQVNEALKAYDFEDLGDALRIEQSSLQPKTHAAVVLGRQRENPDQALAWLAVENPAAVPGLGRKLPHYGRYSYLAFTGDAPDNVLKGQWPVVGSPMSLRVEQSDAVAVEFEPARLKARKALVPPPEQFSRTRMQRDLAFLADENMAGRGLDTPELDRAAEYIAAQFKDAGLQPGGDGDSYLQVWQQEVDALGRVVTLKNVIGVLPGNDPRRASESLVIGAHYDHLGLGEYAGRAENRGKIHPGADDNASGLAVMLELARALKGKSLPRSILFVAFTGEETGRLGSRHFVQHPGPYPVNKAIAMLNLDTVGRLGNRPLTVFGSGTADEWVHIFRGASYVTGVPVRSVADDFGSGDQTSFIAAGVPAVQLFGGVHDDIHRPGDSLDKLDIGGMVKVASVLHQAAQYLAERPEALDATLDRAQEIAAPAGQGARRVSLGTVPDFAYTGEGVRLDDVRSGTPAEGAGLRKGDIITAVNGTTVGNMRQYADALRQLSPGDVIKVRFRRAGVEQTVTARVVER